MAPASKGTLLNIHYYYYYDAIKTITCVAGRKSMGIMAHIRLDYGSKHIAHVQVATAFQEMDLSSVNKVEP